MAQNTLSHLYLLETHLLIVSLLYDNTFHHQHLV